MAELTETMDHAVKAGTEKEEKYVNFVLAGEEYGIGIVVDSVSEVLNIKVEDVENTPSFGTKLNTEHILGMAKMEDSVNILLDIDRVLSDQEIAALEKAA